MFGETEEIQLWGSQRSNKGVVAKAPGITSLIEFASRFRC